MKMLFSGGCKNGKSTLAEDCARSLAKGGPLYYLATMIPRDEEDRERIRRHVASRAGKGFETVECGLGILECLDKMEPGGAFLLDSVTALLSNEMFFRNGMDMAAGERVAAELRELCERCENAVFVSDFIYADSRSYDEYSEAYRAALALCDRTLAEKCDTVVEICLGQPLIYKGGMPL